MNKESSPDQQRKLTLRRLLGILGLALPLILVSGVFVLKHVFKVRIGDTVLQPSISHYYHTAMGDVFVGVVVAYALFLLTYQGYKEKVFWKKDNLFTRAAGFCAILVAFFPTNQIGDCEKFSCYTHFISAVLFFLILAYISFFLFTLSDTPPELRERPKVNRNRIYRFCGGVMFSCILILTLYYLCFKEVWPYWTTFVFESIALFAFGISWLTKGEALFPDR